MKHLANDIPENGLTKLTQDDAIRLSLGRLQQAVYPDQYLTAGVQASQSYYPPVARDNKHADLLRSVLLLVKTATLFAEDDSKPQFVQALWTAITKAAGSMQEYNSKAQTRAERPLHALPQGAERLALLLVGVILPILRQSLTACSHMPESLQLQTSQNASAHRNEALPCTLGTLCELLVCILPSSTQCTVTHRISQLCAEKFVESGESKLCFWDAVSNNIHCIQIHICSAFGRERC